MKSLSTAYWIGVLQSDGKTIFYNRKKGEKIYRVFELGVTVSEKSLPMLEEFCRLSEDVLAKKLRIHKLSNGQYQTHTTGKTVLNTLDKIGISLTNPKAPPIWVTENSKVFGQYLAGIIDGDIRIKRTSSYPQCVIRIATNKTEPRLVTGIKTLLNCAVSITHRNRISTLNGRKIKGRWIEIEFYVSKKNSKIIKNDILPYLKLAHKKEKLSYGLCLDGVAVQHMALSRP